MSTSFAWLILFIAGLCEVAWAVGLKYTEGFSRLGPSLATVAAMVVSVALLGWSAIVFLPLPLWAIVALLVPTGFASGNIIIGFAWAKESLPLRLMGTASGVVNMGPLLGGVFLQPGVGWLLDRGWNGELAGGVRLYDAATWQSSFGLLFATVALALAILPFARETHCRQAV